MGLGRFREREHLVQDGPDVPSREIRPEGAQEGAPAAQDLCVPWFECTTRFERCQWSCAVPWSTALHATKETRVSHAKVFELRYTQN